MSDVQDLRDKLQPDSLARPDRVVFLEVLDILERLEKRIDSVGAVAREAESWAGMLRPIGGHSL